MGKGGYAAGLTSRKKLGRTAHSPQIASPLSYYAAPYYFCQELIEQRAQEQVRGPAGVLSD